MFNGGSMAKKKSAHYVSNNDLLQEIKLYKSTNVISENLGKMLLLMARNYSSKGNFANYTWRQDMISNAVFTCVKYLKNFNIEKSSNAFSYITQIMSNAFKLTIIDEKKQIHVKNICYKSSLIKPMDQETAYSQKSIDYEDIQNTIYDNKEDIHEPNNLWFDEISSCQTIQKMV
jgi:hypothetical protein